MRASAEAGRIVTLLMLFTNVIRIFAIFLFPDPVVVKKC